MAFKLAGSYAIKDAFQKAKPLILEPVMAMEVNVPSEFMGTVIGDLSSRRGQINSTKEDKGFSIIEAEIPLEAVRGYATVIRSLTQGRGSFYMEPKYYKQVPQVIQDQIVSNFTGGNGQKESISTLQSKLQVDKIIKHFIN